MLELCYLISNLHELSTLDLSLSSFWMYPSSDKWHVPLSNPVKLLGSMFAGGEQGRSYCWLILMVCSFLSTTGFDFLMELAVFNQLQPLSSEHHTNQYQQYQASIKTKINQLFNHDQCKISQHSANNKE